METRTETLDLALPDGTTVDAIVARPTAEGTWPGVLVWMDAFGLRPRLEEMAAHVAAQGHLVLVPNLYHRRGRAPVTPLRDLRTEAGRSEAMAARRIKAPDRSMVLFTETVFRCARARRPGRGDKPAGHAA